MTLVGGKAMEKSLKLRIFNNGKDTNDATIRGKYSSTAGYYSKDRFVQKGAFKPIGKKFDVKITTKTGNSGVEKDTVKVSRKSIKNDTKLNRKTMYLAGGYEQFRRIQGFPVNYVNLNLSGSLTGNIQLVRNDGKTLLVITDATEIEKSEHLEKLYRKKIFTPSQTDIAASEEAMAKEVAKIFSEILK